MIHPFISNYIEGRQNQLYVQRSIRSEIDDPTSADPRSHARSHAAPQPQPQRHTRVRSAGKVVWYDVIPMLRIITHAQVGVFQ